MSQIKLDGTPEQKALIRAMASKNRSEADAAKLHFAAFVGIVIKKVLTQAQVVSNLFETIPIGENQPFSLLLDPYDDLQQENFFKVTMQGTAGGLPTNFDYGQEELYVQPFTLSSATSFPKKYLQAARLDVVAKGIQRLADEIMRKREDNMIAPVLQNVATASQTVQTTAGYTTYANVFRADTAGVLNLDDFINLANRAARLRVSQVGGTAGNTNWLRGITDLVLSPEKISDIKRISFNPVNTRQAVGGTTSLQAPEHLRESLFTSAGIPSFYDVNLLPIYEMGLNMRYNSLFQVFAGATQYTDFTGGQTNSFTGSVSEFALGIDATFGALKMPVLIDAESNSEFNVMPDDQFVQRDRKVGFYSDITLGSVVTDSRALVTLVI